MPGAVSQRPKDFPGAAPLWKFEAIGTGLPSWKVQMSPARSGNPLEMRKRHQPGVADAERHLKTDLHLVMG